MDETIQKSEDTQSPETNNLDLGKVDIYLQRHGERGPDGNLTNEGMDQVREEVQRIVGPYLIPDAPPVTFFILNSPSATFIDGKPAGKRAEHSGQVAAEVITHVITQRGVGEDRVILHEFGKSSAGTRAHTKLSEPNYFYIEDAQEPTAYFDALINLLGKEGREEGYFASVDELESLRKEIGAESSPNVASRLTRLIEIIDYYTAAYHAIHPERKAVFLLETHGDVIRSMLQHGMRVEGLEGWQPATGEGIRLELKQGRLSLDLNGVDHHIDVTGRQDRTSEEHN